MSQLFYARCMEFIENRQLVMYGVKGLKKGDTFTLGGQRGAIPGVYEVLKVEGCKTIACRIEKKEEE